MEAVGSFTAPLPPLTLSPSAEWEGELPEGTKDKLPSGVGLVNVWAHRVAAGATKGCCWVEITT